jgi:predicted Zn-dependent protease
MNMKSIAWLALLCCLPCAALELPDMGASASSVLSPADEKRLGEGFMRQLRNGVDIVDDLEVSSYLNALGHQIAAYSDNPEQRFYFFVVNENSINAFAVPGGFVGVHSGLFLHTQNENELASVLAHEIAHVTQHHIARTMEASNNFSLPTMAAIIAGAIAGMKNPQVAQAAIAAVTAGNIQMQINFTRAHEEEADRVGMKMLADSGFDPRSMPIFFERLQASNRFYEGGLPEFLRTHPVTTDRVAEARDRAEQYPKKLLSDSPLYQLARAKLLFLSESDKGKLAKNLQRALQESRYRDERAVRYAIALCLLATRDYKGVQPHLDWLVKHDTDRVAYRSLQARLAAAQNQPAQALQLYSKALQSYPNDPQLTLEYAELLLQQHQAATAKPLLLELHLRNYPEYHRLLALVQRQVGDIVDSYFSMAEFYYVSGRTALALEQIKQARQLKGLDFYQASRIEARHHELQQELHEENAAKKRDQR